MLLEVIGSSYLPLSIILITYQLAICLNTSSFYLPELQILILDIHIYEMSLNKLLSIYNLVGHIVTIIAWQPWCFNNLFSAKCELWASSLPPNMHKSPTIPLSTPSSLCLSTYKTS